MERDCTPENPDPGPLAILGGGEIVERYLRNEFTVDCLPVVAGLAAAGDSAK